MLRIHTEPQVVNKEILKHSKKKKTFKMLKTSDKENKVRCPRKRTHYVQKNKYKTNYGFLI